MKYVIILLALSGCATADWDRTCWQPTTIRYTNRGYEYDRNWQAERVCRENMKQNEQVGRK